MGLYSAKVPWFEEESWHVATTDRIVVEWCPKFGHMIHFWAKKGLVLLISGRCICIWIILFWILSSRFCNFFLCPICVFGALCHSKSLHEKVFARSLMKCHVSVLIAQQHFFFFRRFFLLSKLSVSALFFSSVQKMFLVKCAFSLIAIYFFHVVFGQKFFFLFSPPFLLVYYIPSTIGDLDGVGLWSEVTPLNGQGGFQRIGF